MIALDKQDEYYGFKICWLWSNLQSLLDHDALYTSKIPSQFMLYQKNKNLIALTVSHNTLYMGKN